MSNGQVNHRRLRTANLPHSESLRKTIKPGNSEIRITPSDEKVGHLQVVTT